MNAEELFDFSVTARWGENVDMEIMASVWLYMLTPLGSVPYYREMGTDVKRSEGRPLNISTIIDISKQIVESIQTYNDDHSDSQDDRRVALPFGDIVIDDSGKTTGDLSVTAAYIPIRNLKTESISI